MGMILSSWGLVRGCKKTRHSGAEGRVLGVSFLGWGEKKGKLCAK